MQTKSKSSLVLMSLLVLAMLVTLVGCQCGGTETPAATTAPQATDAPKATDKPAGMSGTISLAGSTTVQPVAEKLGEAFSAANPDVKIDVQGGGSSVGVKSAGEGTVDIGNASREIKDSEIDTYPDLVIHTIARDGIAIVVNPGVTVDGLTKAEVQAIFAGEIANWSEVGGPDKAIVVVSREEGSGTRAAFEEMVMGEEAVIVDTAILQPSNGAVKTTVSTTDDAIGFLSFGYLDASVKAVDIDGVKATVDNAKSGTYPIVRPLNMLTNGEPTGVVKAFLDFVMSAEGQAVVEEEGYLSIK
jgi:phosphate transport system substrate-binding protein